MWEKFKSNVMRYPWLFGGIAAVVLLWVFWPRGGGGSSNADAAVQSQAIAQTAMANASLMLANEETRRVAITTDAATTQLGLQTEAAVAMNAANIAGTQALAQIASNALMYEQDTAVKLADIQAGAQGAVYDAIIASQESAQKWALDVEAQAGILPGTFETFGFTSSAPTIIKTPPAARSNPTYSQPVSGGYYGGADDIDGDGWVGTNDWNEGDPNVGAYPNAGGGGGGGK